MANGDISPMCAVTVGLFSSFAPLRSGGGAKLIPPTASVICCSISGALSLTFPWLCSRPPGATVAGVLLTKQCSAAAAAFQQSHHKLGSAFMAYGVWNISSIALSGESRVLRVACVLLKGFIFSVHAEHSQVHKSAVYRSDAQNGPGGV